MEKTLQDWLQAFIQRKTIYSQATHYWTEEEIEIGYDAYYFDVSRDGKPWEVKIVVDKEGHWTLISMYHREDTEQCNSWQYLGHWEEWI